MMKTASEEASFFMKKALAEARKAYKKGEVPVGAVVTHGGKIVSFGHNLREYKNNALKHAEIIAIERACKKLGSWRLDGCNLYVTLEPCPMCAGAIIQARINSVFFGAADAKTGAAGSVVNLFEKDLFNHNVMVYSNVMETECSEIIKCFFRDLRNK